MASRSRRRSASRCEPIEGSSKSWQTRRLARGYRCCKPRGVLLNRTCAVIWSGTGPRLQTHKGSSELCTSAVSDWSPSCAANPRGSSELESANRPYSRVRGCCKPRQVLLNLVAVVRRANPSQCCKLIEVILNPHHRRHLHSRYRRCKPRGVLLNRARRFPDAAFRDAANRQVFV